MDPVNKTNEVADIKEVDENDSSKIVSTKEVDKNEDVGAKEVDENDSSEDVSTTDDVVENIRNLARFIERSYWSKTYGPSFFPSGRRNQALDDHMAFMDRYHAVRRQNRDLDSD